ncbi:OmpA family protein [Aquimarina algiphila]|uniref:OmpA family protein n=1 Tax=Aquimarina algiphila TaxID=2047982 RepID=A0A554VMJ2_9FLAO|nr:OmpA family protein [Aquimarina algiphila]TSE09518.1 OmpA family protein [Aquimarina algiphila]
MKNRILLILIFFFSTFIYAQKSKVADKFFKDFAYLKAKELYKDALKKEDSTKHILSRIGDCYYNNSNSEQAYFWYNKAISKYKDIAPEYIYKYIQTLRSLGHFDEANNWLKKLKAHQKNSRRLKGSEDITLEKFQELSSTKDKYIRIVNLSSNSKYSDFGGYERNGSLYFSSSRANDSLFGKQKIYKWNGEPYLNIYQSTIERIDSTLVISNITPITSDKINLKNEHEGALAITNDGKTLYFTRNNINKRKKASYDKEGNSNLKLYRAKLRNRLWTDIEELPFNGKTFSTGHPALSPDEKTLYFVSNREGGYGQSDIYKVAINTDGTFGNIENLGDRINTEGREVFPFVAKDSTLYFSSDSHINLGLLDIYKSDILKKDIDEDIEIKNLGAPFNSGYDDFAFFSNPTGDSGYFSSNRTGGIGSDDIYTFDRYECMQILTGITYDKNTSEPLPEVTVQIIDQTGKIISSTLSNKNGEYTFEEIPCGKTFSIFATKANYKPDSKEFSTTTKNKDKTEIDLYLTPLIINKEIVINPIFFDFDKYEIRTDAAYELENIVSVMKENSKMIIKIESHTDSRGADRYNLKLSQRRAKSTRDYIISRGINTERIPSFVGYGESQLLNKCGKGYDRQCTEKDHEENRRSAFLILNDYK